MAGRAVHVSYANVMSTIAVFIALGGSGYAAVTLSKNSVTSDAIRAGAVKNADVANNAITSAKVRNGSLRPVDFAGGLPTLGAASSTPGPAGSAGPAGEKGDKGDPGAPGAPCASSDPACRGPQGVAGPPGPTNGFSDTTNWGTGDGPPSTVEAFDVDLAAPGKVFAIGTVETGTGCATQVCHTWVHITVDGVPIIGSTRALAAGPGDREDAELTVFGVSPRLPAGSHRVVLALRSQGGAYVGERHLSAVTLGG